MPPALFGIALVAALLVCALGLALRAADWLRIGIGRDARDIPPSRRLGATVATVAAALRGHRGAKLVGTFVLDALLGRRLFADAKLRAVAHGLVLAGFTMLVWMHALAPLVTARAFPGYQPTLEPWLFLRNLFGAMAIAGLAWLVVARRGVRRPVTRRARRFGSAFVVLLGTVLVSGFLLEAHKIASPRAFERMVAQFAGGADAAALDALRAHWAREQGVVFGDRADARATASGTGNDAAERDAAIVAERGLRVHERACESCHAKASHAFVSWPVSRAMAPVTRGLDAANADAWLLHLHVLACLAGLAALPFTSFLHAVAAPASLLLAGVARERAASGAALAGEVRAARSALALDACVRCGLCDRECSVAPLARWLGNGAVLPSQKVVATRAFAIAGARPEPRRATAPHAEDAPRTADGAFLCTDCGRCTEACPVGLDLADLWTAGRADLSAAGLSRPATWVQAQPAVAWAERLERFAKAPASTASEGSWPATARTAPAPLAALAPISAAAPLAAVAAPAPLVPLAFDRRAFSRCVQCQTCTNVCPVVAHGSAEGAIDLTPQKVMNLLRLGLVDYALGSRMVWSCATCYACQQICPEGIRVTDILCELRSLAVQRLSGLRGGE